MIRLVLLIAVLAISSCSPRVELAPSSEPITVNLNVKIDHEVKIKVERDLEQVISPDSKLF